MFFNFSIETQYFIKKIQILQINESSSWITSSKHTIRLYVCFLNWEYKEFLFIMMIYELLSTLTSI